MSRRLKRGASVRIRRLNPTLPSLTGGIIMFKNGVSALRVVAFRELLTLPSAAEILPDLIELDLTWFDLISLDLTWFRLMRLELTSFRLIWLDFTWFDLIWLDLTWFGLIWRDWNWFDLIWLVWPGFALIWVLLGDLVWLPLQSTLPSLRRNIIMF